MTANQLKYWSLQEDKRANKAKEFETNRANVAKEQNERGKLNETIRHNQHTEFIDTANTAIKTVDTAANVASKFIPFI